MRSLKLVPAVLTALFSMSQLVPSCLAGPPSGWLGVMLGQDGGGPVEVYSVFPDSPAGRAGLQAGDVIVAVNGTRVDSDRASALKEALSGHEAGERVRLRVLRDGMERTIRARLGERPQDLQGQVSKLQAELERVESRERGQEMRAELHRLREHELKSGREHALRPKLDLEMGRLRGQWRDAAPPRLGVAVETVTGQFAEYFEVDSGSLLIRDVVEGSPAEEAGLRAGDVLLRVGGESVGTLQELRRVLDRHGRGESVELELLRRGSPHVFRALLDGGGAPQTAPRVHGRHSLGR